MLKMKRSMQNQIETRRSRLMLRSSLLLPALLFLGVIPAWSQTTATWVGPASGGEWNDTNNWDIGAAPGGAAVNAVIGPSASVDYRLPMAAGFGTLTNHGILNTHTSMFSCVSIVMLHPNTARFLAHTTAVVNLSGNFAFCSNNAANLAAGSSLMVGGSLLIGCGSTGGSSPGTPGSFAFMTNAGGYLAAGSTALNPGDAAVATSPLLAITGGFSSLGDLTVNRGSGSAAAPPPLGTEGLVVSNGVTLMANAAITATPVNSLATVHLAGGAMTNTASLALKAVKPGALARFVQTGGFFASTHTNAIALEPSGVASIAYSVLGGTHVVAGFAFGDAASGPGTIYFTNGAAIYLGSAGMHTNLGVTLQSALNDGALFGATADWTEDVPLTLTGGTTTFHAADLAGAPRRITLAGLLSGPGALAKTGPGTVSITHTTMITGVISIRAGTLALAQGGSGSVGALPNSPAITVAAGARFDVSDVPGGFVHMPNATLGGLGVVTGTVALASGAILNPGSNTLAGALSFSNSVTETGGAVNHFDLSGNPAGPENDLLLIAGDLNLSHTNLVEITGGAPGRVYPLIKYGGALNGGITNLVLPSALGTLSNNPSLKTIYVIAANPPPFTSARVIGTNFVLAGSNGVAGSSFTVLAATNVGLPLTNWSPVGSGVFDANGGFVSTNAIDPAKPQRFYRLQLAP
jgi:hypothetical protein